MPIDKNAIVENRALTHRLEVLANEAININDPLFVQRIGCTIREYRVLKMIHEHNGIAFNEIMHVTGLDRSLVSRLIRSLLKQELIYRINSEEDARRFGLFTTKAGITACEQGNQLSAEAEEVLFEPLQQGELEQLHSLLNKLVFWVRDPTYKHHLDALHTAVEADA